MKKTFLLLLFSSVCFSQTGIIDYKVELIKEKEKKKEHIENIDKEYPLLSFSLKYDNKNSFFSRKKSLPHNMFSRKIALVLINANKNWYQNLLENEVVGKVTHKRKTYHVLYEKMKSIDWKLKKETKVIDGYVCYKAERKELNKRTGNYVPIIAWYTPDIPVPYGPIGEGGLPGLILKLERNNFFAYLVKKIVLNPKKLKVPLLENIKKIDSDELVRLMRKARKVTVD